MMWRELFGLSLAVSLAGCAGSQTDLISQHADIPALMGEAAARPGVTRPDARSDDGARGQKAEKEENPLDLPPEKPGSPQRTVRICASVNGEPILEEEVVTALQGMGRSLSAEQRRDVLNRKLDELIDREVVIQDAYLKLSKPGASKFLDALKQAAAAAFEKEWLQPMMKGNGYTDEKEFRKYLRENQMPLELVRRQWERNFIAMEYMRHRVEPAMMKLGHLQVAEYYDKHPEEFQVEDSVTWQDLFIAAGGYPTREQAKQFAESLAQRVRKGEDFVKLAKEFDKGTASFDKNAEGQGHKRGEIRPHELEPVLFGLKEGEVGPVVEIHTGYHVVRVTKRQRAGRMPFDSKVQKTIQNKLRNEVYNREMKRILAELKRKAEIIKANNEP